LVVFVCQDRAQCEQFLNAADRELTGHLWHPGASPDRYEYVGRDRVLFALERDAHARDLAALRLPAFPAGHPHAERRVRRAMLPSATRAAAAGPRQLRLLRHVA
jgi:hypothetical protein